ncbi:MAG: VCBS repeat-containing protein [Planctomycetota bacterium]
MTPKASSLVLASLFAAGLHAGLAAQGPDQFRNEFVNYFRGGANTTGFAPGVVAGDYDGDSRTDLGYFDGSGWSVALQGVSREFTNVAGPTLAVLPRLEPAVAADLDSDGLDEIVFFDLLPGPESSPNLYWVSPLLGTQGSIALPGIPFGLAAGDLDADGDPDFVISFQYGGPLPQIPDIALRNDGSGSLSEIVGAFEYRSDVPGYIGLVDVDGDGDLDRVKEPAFFQPGRNAITRIAVGVNDGTGSFLRRQTLMVPRQGVNSGDGSVEEISRFVDVDGDGDLDRVGRNIGSLPFRLEVFENRGDGVFTPLPAPLIPSNNQFLLGPEFVDFDQDGDLDLLVSANQLKYHENLGGGVFDPNGVVLRSDVRLRAVSILDLDSDGDQDVLTGRIPTINQNSDVVASQFLPIGDQYLVTMTLLDDPSTNGSGFGALLVSTDLDPIVTPLGVSSLQTPLTVEAFAFDEFAELEAFAFAIPNDPALVGVHLLAQGAFARLDGRGDVDIFLGATVRTELVP